MKNDWNVKPYDMTEIPLPEKVEISTESLEHLILKYLQVYMSEHSANYVPVKKIYDKFSGRYSHKQVQQALKILRNNIIIGQPTEGIPESEWGKDYYITVHGYGVLDKLDERKNWSDFSVDSIFHNWE